MRIFLDVLSFRAKTGRIPFLNVALTTPLTNLGLFLTNYILIRYHTCLICAAEVTTQHFRRRRGTVDDFSVIFLKYFIGKVVSST